MNIYYQHTFIKILTYILLIVSFSLMSKLSNGQEKSGKSKKQERKEQREKKKEDKAKRLASM